MIEIRLDGDPVAKGRPRFSRKSGRAYTPAKTASYESRLGWAAQSVMNGRALLGGALDVTVMAFIAVPASWSVKKRAAAVDQQLRPTSRPDSDNFAKCLDSLNKIVWLDDSQIVDLHVYKKYSERPRLEISIRDLTSDDLFG